MTWKILRENQRKFADGSYYLKAENNIENARLVLEICWAQIMYALSVELIRGNSDSEHIYSCMVFSEDRIEKYGHQIMRMTSKSPLRKLKRLSEMQKDGVLNHVLSEKYGVTYKTTLPSLNE